MRLLHRPFVQVLLLLMAVLIFAAVMSKYFPLPPEFFCMEYPDGAGCEQVRQSPCPDCQPPGPIESFVGAMLGFWQFFFLMVWLLPSKYGDAIWKIAFPFLPGKTYEAERDQPGVEKEK